MGLRSSLIDATHDHDHPNDRTPECPGIYGHEQNHVFRFPLSDGQFGTIARTWLCFASGKMYHFQMIFDDDEHWYVGTGDPESYVVDTWGIATHEFGHGTGWVVHFDEQGLCDQTSPYDWGVLAHNVQRRRGVDSIRDRLRQEVSPVA